MKVGDLIIGEQGNIGMIVRASLKPDHFWICWTTGGLRNKTTMENKHMVFPYHGVKIK